MSQSHIIEVDGAFVGVAVRIDRGYRFVATDLRLDELDTSIWPTLDDVRTRAPVPAGCDLGWPGLAGAACRCSPHLGQGRLKPVITRRHVLAAVPSLGIVGAHAFAAPSTVLRVGFQKGEPILLLAKQNRHLEALLNPLGVDVRWIEFQFGPPLLEAMRVNAIDIGAVGDTPPVFAQAAHGDLLYIAAQRSGGQGILVPPGSSLQTLHDLKGKKVAFGRGSSAHNLTIAALEKGGLSYADIQPTYLGPADAGAAFERGAIDAWTIWDPYYALFETRPGVRVLAKWTEITEQNSFFMGGRAYVEANTQIAAKVVAEFARIAAWAREHRPELADALAKETGMPLQAVQRAVERAPLEVMPMNDGIAQTQQTVANRFRSLGLIPADIRISDQIWKASS